MPHEHDINCLTDIGGGKIACKYERGMAAARAPHKVEVLYYSSGMLAGPASKFSSVAEAARDVKRNFDNRFYDEAHITEDGKAVAHVHRYHKSESRWYGKREHVPGKRPASLARYFEAEGPVHHSGVTRSPMAAAEMITSLGKKLPYMSGGQGVLSVGSDLKDSVRHAAYIQSTKIDYNWPTVARTYLHFAKNMSHPSERRKIYKQVYDVLVHTDYGDGKSPAERKATVGK